MASLGELYWNLRLLDFTDADIKRANEKLRSLGSDVQIDDKKLRASIDSILSNAFKITLEGKATQEDLQKAVEGKVVRVEILPLLTRMRAEIKAATSQTPVEVEIAPNAATLRRAIENACLKQGFTLTINTINDEFTKKIRQKLDGETYIAKITCDPTVIVRSIQTALMNMQTGAFGLMVSRDILHRSINDALTGHQFPIQIKVLRDQARAAVQTALQGAANVTGADAQKAQRLATAELRAAQAELARLKAAHLGAADAAGMHARASLNLGGAMGSNIRIAGELGSAMASLYSIHAAKEFLAQVIEIGGELEHQKIALDTIYGDPGKTQTLFSQIKSLARESPFGVMDLTKNIKQLSAYGVAYNEVFDTAKRLADISAATSVDISRLILAFGKTKNRTFLDGLEAKQFAYANIPIYDALSKKLTELEGKFVSVKDVMGRIKKREIGFDMVKEILWDMTDEGGKFYNMQEKLAGSVKTSWKLVRDNIELMFGEIAEGKVGSALKWLAELLQGMTRNWQTLGVVVGATAGAFAISRLAVAAHSVILEKNTSAAIKKLASQRMIIAANAGAAISYRRLTTEELMNVNASRGLRKIEGLRILTRTQLTTKEVQAMMAAKALTREELLKLVALKKVSVATAEKVLITKNSTAADAAATRTAIADAAATKKRTVVMAQFRASLTGVGMALKGLFLNPWTAIMAGIMAVTHLIMKQSEETRKAKEIGDNLFTKATEGAKSLKQTVESIKPANQLSKLEVFQSIEQLENVIKDYSPTPFKDINESLVSQTGHVNSLTERFEILTQKVKELKAAYDGIASSAINGMANTIEAALKHTDEGAFRDGLAENAKDYTNALKLREDIILRVSTDEKKYATELIKYLEDMSSKFKNNTKDCQGLEEKVRHLAENATAYADVLKEIETYKFNKEDWKKIASITYDRAGVKESLDELRADTYRFIDGINSNLKSKGINPFLMTDEQKRELQISLKHTLDSMEEAGEDAKAIIAKKLEEAYNITLMEDKIGPSIQEHFKKLANDSVDAYVQSAVIKMKVDGYESLSSAEKEAVKKLGDVAKAQAMGDLELTNKEMADYLKSHPLTQVIQLVYTESNQISDLGKELIRTKGYTPALTQDTYQLVESWTKSGKVYDSRNAAWEARKAAYNELKAAKAAGVGIEEAQKEWDKVEAALQYLGWTDLETKDQKSNKHAGKGSKKDTVAESIKQRFKDLKDAWSEYQKWAKTIGGDEAASKIAKSGLFGGMSEKDIPRDAEQFKKAVKSLYDELEKAGIKGHSQRESLANEIIKNILDIDKTRLDESIKNALDRIENELERQLTDWNLYDKILKATGDKKLAYSFSFGISGGETDYVSMIKNQFDRRAEAYEKAIKKRDDSYTIEGYTFADLDKLYKESGTDEGLSKWLDVPEEIRKVYENANKDILKYYDEQRNAVADLLGEYQTAQEKIEQIREKMNSDIKKVEGSKDLSSAQKDSLISKIRAKGEYDIFTQSSEYLQFFSGIYALTKTEAERIGDLIKQNLDKKLQAGQISAKEYYDEIEKIEKQLKKIRSVKSDALTFMTGGIHGLYDKKLEVNDAKRLEQMQKIEDAENRILKAREANDKNAEEAAMKDKEAAKAELANLDKIREALLGTIEKWNTILQVCQLCSSIVNGLVDSFNSIRDMAASFGADVESSGWGNIEAVLGTAQSMLDGVTKTVQSAINGDIGGVLSGAVSTITKPFTIWNELHDKNRQRRINASKREYNEYSRMIDALQRKMERFLGNAALMDIGVEGGGYGQQRQLMEKQLAELEYQKRQMEGMKNKDPEAIAEIDAQISELRDNIKSFAEEMAGTVYSIDLTGWAEQIGDSLVDAFAAGEDAAEAFDKTVGDIMRSVVSKMISADILAPMFKDLENYLFGADGKSGAYGKDFFLDEKEAATMGKMLTEIKTDGLERARELYDNINAVLGGMLDDTESASSGLSAGIQGITEETAGILASYVNAIRAYCLEHNLDFKQLMQDHLPKLSLIAEAQLSQLNSIAENTRRNMIAAESMLSAVENIYNTLNKATTSTSWGFYVR